MDDYYLIPSTSSVVFQIKTGPISRHDPSWEDGLGSQPTLLRFENSMDRPDLLRMGKQRFAGWDSSH